MRLAFDAADFFPLPAPAGFFFFAAGFDFFFGAGFAGFVAGFVAAGLVFFLAAGACAGSDTLAAGTTGAVEGDSGEGERADAA